MGRLPKKGRREGKEESSHPAAAAAGTPTDRRSVRRLSLRIPLECEEGSRGRRRRDKKKDDVLTPATPKKETNEPR